MLFNSYVFLFGFLPIALAGYYFLAHRVSVMHAKVWLCAASFVFYGWWNPAFLLLLCGSIAFNYWVSVHLDDHQNETRQGWILAGGVSANLALLFFYKYLFPFLGFLRHLGWIQTDFGSVVLPIGISFFTFTQIGYLVDCRQGQVTERGLINYLLFVTFFPHLIAGPILHHREIMPQFANDATYRFRSENLAIGLTVFAVGIIKKVLLADSIAPWAESGFAHVEGMQALQAWSVMLAYSMQLYFDFSGYSDMAVGLGIMFGVKLPMNFNSPYQSLSIIDFWQRWHMTLTRYLTLLLYNPISLSISRYRQRSGYSTGRQAAATPSGFMVLIVFPTLMTLFLAGIWHGAGLQFIVYGLLHGIYLSVNHLWRTVRTPVVMTKVHGLAKAWAIGWRVVLTYIAVLIAQVYFRANDTADATRLLASGFGMYGSGLPLVVPIGNLHYLGMLQQSLLNHHLVVVGPRYLYDEATRAMLTNLGLALGLMILAFGMPNIYQIMGTNSPALGKVKPMHWTFLSWRPSPVWATAIGILLFVAVQYFDHTARFLYFQF